jgi:hypothetical protein
LYEENCDEYGELSSRSLPKTCFQTNIPISSPSASSFAFTTNDAIPAKYSCLSQWNDFAFYIIDSNNKLARVVVVVVVVAVRVTTTSSCNMDVCNRENPSLAVRRRHDLKPNSL